MANYTMFLTLLSLLMISVALHNSQLVSSNDEHNHEMMEDEEEDHEYYVVDTPLQAGRSRSRFLASIIKKGTRCDRETNNICHNVRANKGRDLLFCCKKHCRNVLSDKNNCGVCGHKCNLGERCCGGVCTNVLSNARHCGKCNKECSPGDSCGNGFCGYA